MIAQNLRDLSDPAARFGIAAFPHQEAGTRIFL